MSGTKGAHKSRWTSRLPRGRWSRRFVLAGGGLVILVLVLRVVLWLALPSILDRAARVYGLRCTYEDLSLTLVTGDLELWHLMLTPIEGGDPVMDAEYCRGDVLLGALLRGRLVVRRLEVDGIDVFLDRDADGGFPALQGVADALRKTAEESTEEAIEVAVEDEPPGEPPGEIDFTLPLELDALRLQHCHVFLRDASLTPPAETRLDVNLRVSDIGSTKRRTRFRLTLASPRVLGQLSVEGRASSQGQKLEADIRVLGRGLRPVERAVYLEAWGLRPTNAKLSVELVGQVKLEPSALSAAAGSALTGRISLKRVSLHADDDEQLALDRAEVEVESLTPRELRVARVAFEGGRVLLRRQSSGVPTFGGLEFLRVPGREYAAASEPARASQPVAKAPPRTALNWSVGEVTFRDFRGVVQDRVVAADHEQSFELEELVVSEIRSEAGAPPVRVRADFAVPGLVESLRLEGEATPLAPRKTVKLEVSGAGITARSAAPYLAAFGVEPLLQDGRFSATLDASISGGGADDLLADFSLRDVLFADTEELFAFGGIEVSGVRMASSADRILVDHVAVSGPGFSVEREASGVVQGFGFQWDPRKKVVAQKSSAQPDRNPAQLTRAIARVDDASLDPAVAQVEPAAGPSPAPTPQSIPTVEFRHFVWNGQPIRFVDRAVTPATTIELSGCAVEVENLVIGPGASGQAEAGQFQASCSLPGLIEEITASGTIQTTEREARVSAEVLGEGVTARASAPYLEALGLEPALVDGQFHTRLHAAFASIEDGVSASLELKETTLVDQHEELLGVTGVTIDGVRLQPGRIHVGAVDVEEPRAFAWRTAEGEVTGAVFRVKGPPPSEGSGESGEEAEVGTTPAGGERRPRDAVASPAVVELDRFRLTGATLRWRDEACDPPIDTSIILETFLDDLTTREGASPASFEVAMTVPGSLERLRLSGGLLWTPSRQGFEAELDVSGLRAGPLAAYFPEGTRLTLEDGRLAARMHASVGRHDEGGHQGQLVMEDLSYRDGARDFVFLSIEEVRAAVSRFDPQGGLIDVDEVSVAGLCGGLERSAEGELLVLGLGVSPESPVAAEEVGALDGDEAIDEPSSSVSAEGAVQETPAAASGGGDGGDDAVGVASATPATPATPGTARPQRPIEWPRVRLRRLDLEIERFSLTDHARPRSRPLVVSELRLQSLDEFEVLGEEPESQPPLRFGLTGSVEPLVESISVKTEVSPFASVPLLKSEWTVGGIRGEGLTGLVPELEDLVDGTRLTDGRLTGRLELNLYLKRRHPLELDLRDGLGLNLRLEDVRFREGEEGRVWAGLDLAEVDVIRADAAGNVHIRRIELETPRAHVSREEDGLHVLGLVIAEAEADAVEEAAGSEVEMATAEELALEEEIDAGAGEEGVEESGVAAADAVAPTPEIRIDRVLVSGLDVSVVDETVDPRMVLPLNDLDVEIQGITTRAFEERRFLRLQALLSADGVRLPARVGTEGEFEERPLFAEAAASGRLALYPKPEGWFKLGMSSLELANFKGSAAAAGFGLHDGVFDSRIDLRLSGDGTMAVSTRLIFTDLRMEEGEKGPISSLLGLGVPLDAVIFVLRDENGAVNIPVDFECEDDGIGGGQMLAAGHGALVSVIRDAIASSPFRAVGALGKFVVPEKEEETEEPLVLHFEPGVTGSSRAHRREIAPLLERMAEEDDLALTLRHELGTDDVAIAATRVNPSRQDCLHLLGQLRERHLELLGRRAELVAEARAAYAVGDAPGAKARTETLRAVDTELGDTESALDDILALLRSGAERHASRRTRDACVAIGAARLAVVREALLSDLSDLSGGGDGFEARVQIVRPRNRVAKYRTRSEVTITPTVRKAR